MIPSPEAEASAQADADRALPDTELGALIRQLNARIVELNHEGSELGEQIRALMARASEVNAEAQATYWRLNGLVKHETVSALRFNGNYL